MSDSPSVTKPMTPPAKSNGGPVLVTGGTGFLGAHLLDALASDGSGRELRALARGTYEPLVGGEGKKSASPSSSIQVIRGDVVGDGGALAEALRGCEEVYHLAGLVSRDPDAGAAMMRVHVEGTARLLRAAREAGVRRVVVASSSGTIAVSRDADPILDENAGYATELVSGWPYYLSKIYQEKTAFDLAGSLGLEVVVVSPSLLLGPGDRRGSSTGDVLRFLRRQIPVVPSGGISFVDVRDAAAATVAAMRAGRPGQRYLLGGPNWTFADFFGRLERASKVPGPWLRLPDRLAERGASVIEALCKQLEREPPVDRISVEMSRYFWYCDSSKAERELAFETRDPAETLDETIRDLRKRNRI